MHRFPKSNFFDFFVAFFARERFARDPICTTAINPHAVDDNDKSRRFFRLILGMFGDECFLRFFELLRPKVVFSTLFVGDFRYAQGTDTKPLFVHVFAYANAEGIEGLFAVAVRPPKERVGNIRAE